LSYLPDSQSIERSLIAAAKALRPGGVLAIDLCDLEWAETRRNDPPSGRIGDDWAIITEYNVPAPDRFVRNITTFLRNKDDTWRRDDEQHDNVLVEVLRVPHLLKPHGVFTKSQ